jgi:hypothetical protein
VLSRVKISHGLVSAPAASFLESAVAWAVDTTFGFDQGLTASNRWKQFAAFLLAGKIYE